MMHECPACRTMNPVKDGSCRCATCGRFLQLRASDLRKIAARLKVLAALRRYSIGDGSGHTPAA
jgi:hypothetical protein